MPLAEELSQEVLANASGTLPTKEDPPVRLRRPTAQTQVVDREAAQDRTIAAPVAQVKRLRAKLAEYEDLRTGRPHDLAVT